MTALAAETELEAELFFTQHIQGVQNFETDAFEQLFKGSVNSWITRQLQG